LKVVPRGDLDSRAKRRRQLEVDILVTGHAHQFTAYKHEGGVVINPGSAAGDYGNITYDVNPSFVLMDIDGLRIVVSVYELNIDGGVQVDRIGLKKTTATTHSPFIESAACRILSFCFFFFSWYCIWIKVKRVTILMI
jgi:vacuolar protein sorting-associated protein 29